MKVILVVGSESASRHLVITAIKRVVPGAAVSMRGDDLGQTILEMRMLFVPANVLVFVCKNPEEAIEISHKFVISLLITDSSFGAFSEMDGLSLAQHMKACQPLRVLMLSDKGNVRTHTRSVDTFLSKPFYFFTLEEEIKNLLQGSRRHLEMAVWAE